MTKKFGTSTGCQYHIYIYIYIYKILLKRLEIEREREIERDRVISIGKFIVSVKIWGDVTFCKKQQIVLLAKMEK